jgi:hypothetical protein
MAIGSAGRAARAMNRRRWVNSTFDWHAALIRLLRITIGRRVA